MHIRKVTMVAPKMAQEPYLGSKVVAKLNADIGLVGNVLTLLNGAKKPASSSK